MFHCFSIDQFAIVFSWNLQWDILEYIEACGDKGNILIQKLERCFLINCFVFLNSSHRVTRTFSCSGLVEHSLGNMRREILDRIEADGADRNVPR